MVQSACSKLVNRNDPLSTSNQSDLLGVAGMRRKCFHRFEGQKISRPGPIALIVNDAIGNFVVASSIAQKMRNVWNPEEIVLFSGKRTEEFHRSDLLYRQVETLFGLDVEDSIKLLSTWGNYFDVVVNLEDSPLAKIAAATIVGHEGLVIGGCAAPDGRGDLPYQHDWRGQISCDRNWTSPTLTQTYMELNSPFIGDIFCAMCYFEGQAPAYKVPMEIPKHDIPDVILSASASLDSKLWPVEKWLKAVKIFEKKGLSIGLVGASRKVQSHYWKGSEIEDQITHSTSVVDFRGKFSLPEVVGALSKVKFVMTIDNGILHLACAANAPVIGFYREGIHRLWRPPNSQVTALIPSKGRSVSSISIQKVEEAIHGLI